ncbi:PBP1A family penicillin-binding protein [bacterium]|nr:PBP1A family penicillin-binding protein [bacterium]
MSKYYRKSSLLPKKSSIGKRILSFVLFLLVVSIGSVFAYFSTVVKEYARELPSAKDILIQPEESSQILDQNGKLLKILFLSEQRLYVKLSDISPALQNAIIASEDERFYQHHGFDLRAFLRAVVKNLITQDFSEGGSTITQQLARNVFLTMDKTISRKVKEIILSTRIEQTFKKTEILELYLNQSYFGEGCYGVETTARKFFNKPAKEINLAEASLMTAILPAPSIYTVKHIDTVLKAKQRGVLDKMVKNGYITKEEADQAWAAPITVQEKETVSNNQTLLADGADYFIDYVKEEAVKILSVSELYKGGLKIYTTLDSDVQHEAYHSFTQVLNQAEKEGVLPTGKKDTLGTLQPQGAIVSLSPKTGKILAIVGGRDYQNTKFNRALAERQPGSSFKIFPYTASIDHGLLGPESYLVSEAVNIDGWRPKEWTSGFFGKMTVRRAIAISSNIAAIKAMLKVGVAETVVYARKMGITSNLIEVPSIALGTVEVKPLDMASAYGVVANKGVYNPPYAILKIEKRELADPIYEHQDSPKQVISPQAAYLMTDLLKGPLSSDGTASQIRVDGIPLAGKTGTTENFRDGWFVGITPSLATAVYVGADSKEIDLSFVANYGSTFSGKIFHDFIASLYLPLGSAKFHDEDWIKPEGYITLRVCNASGRLARTNCPYHIETRIMGAEMDYCTDKHVPPVKNPDQKTDPKQPNENDPEEGGKEPEKTPGAEDPNQPDKPQNPIDPNNPTPPTESEPSPSQPNEPDSSFYRSPVSESDLFRVEFGTNQINFRSPVDINCSILDPLGASIEIYVNGQLVAFLTEYPYRYYYLPETTGENLFQAVLKSGSGQILGTKIYYFWVFSS